MAIPLSTILEFEKTTRFPLREYIRLYVDFIDIHRANITSYYSGASERPNDLSFQRMEDLLAKSRRLNDVIDNLKDTMRHAADWELYETISDLFTSLLTVDNSSKWLRSSITKNNFSPEVEVQETLQMRQTLERLSGDVLGSTNRENDWVSIALRNDLAEDDYTPDGGNVLNVSYSNKRTIQVNSIVDNITGDRIYGIDIQRKLEFSKLSSDLVALAPRETLLQSVEILSTLKQGDSPEFPGEGLQSGIIGTNQNSIAYPVLFRQYYNTFAKDDTLKALAISNITHEEDAVLIDFTVETRLGELIETQSEI